MRKVVNFNQATGNFVQSNVIGTNRNGTADLGNDLDGILLNNAYGNVIGNAQPGSDAGNLISGNSGDEKYARLFGYLTTNQDGQYEVRTIRPAGYPQSNLPAHIHVEIEVREPAPGAANGTTANEPRMLISEIQFDDDPRQTKEMRARAARDGSLIFPVTRAADGAQHVKADFIVGER